MDIRSTLSGAWRVLQIVEAGLSSVPDDQCLWFAGDVIFTGSRDAAWEMPYTLLGETLPVAIDITRADQWEPWLERGILDVVGERLRLCTAGSEGAARPTDFASSASDGHTLYLAERCDEPLPE